jgi:hypothetical protein
MSDDEDVKFVAKSLFSHIRAWDCWAASIMIDSSRASCEQHAQAQCHNRKHPFCGSEKHSHFICPIKSLRTNERL